MSFFWDLLKSAVVNSFLFAGSILYMIFQFFVFLIVIGVPLSLICGFLTTH